MKLLVNPFLSKIIDWKSRTQEIRPSGSEEVGNKQTVSAYPYLVFE